MDAITEHNRKYQFFRDITGVAMKVYNKYRPGLGFSPQTVTDAEQPTDSTEAVTSADTLRLVIADKRLSQSDSVIRRTEEDVMVY